MDIDSPDPQSDAASTTKGKKSQREKVLPFPQTEGYASFDFWKKEIKAAEQKRDSDYRPDWDRNVNSYLCHPVIQTPDIDKVIVPKDFSNVEQKKAALFFQLPMLQCVPMRPDLADAVPLAQAVLRFYLGRHRVDAMTLMSEILFDALTLSALMCSKIGYESVQDGTKLVTLQQPNPQGGQPAPPAPPLGGTPPAAAPTGQPPMGGTPPPTPSPAPTQSPGSILGLSAPPQPQSLPMQVPVPRIISERYFWERISPAKLLIPEKFTGSNYDLAPWLGFEFVEPWDVAKRKYSLTDDDITRFSGDDDHLVKSDKNVTTRATIDTVRGWEIYYRAALYDPTVKNPDLVRLLVLLDGHDEPVRHRDSPYQKADPQTGKLMGMKGYPVHVGAVRYVSDLAYPPSETQISRTLVDELGKFRTQMILLRDRAVPTILYDEMRLGGPQTAEKIRRGILGGWIPVPQLDPNSPPIMEAAKAHANQDNYRANDYIDRDIEAVWAFGPNQHGQEALESRSATEMNLAQAAANTRIGKDRERVVDYFLKGSEKLWSLLQMFADDEQFVEILGDDGARRFQKWDKHAIAGEFVFEAKADSAQQPDYNTDRMMALKAYELLAKDPNVNRTEILHRIAQTFDYDPSRLIQDQLPPKGPEPGKITFSVKGEELDIGKPEFPIWLAILRQSGYNIPDDLIAQVQAHKQQQSAIMTQMASMGIGGDPQAAAGLLPAPVGAVPPTPQIPQSHGGMATKAPRLNKHGDKQTGEIPGPKIAGAGRGRVQ